MERYGLPDTETLKTLSKDQWKLMVKKAIRQHWTEQLCGEAETKSTLERCQLELSASNTVKVDYRLPVTCSDFNSTTVNSLGLDFIDLLPVTLSISCRCLNVVSNTDFYAICSHYNHFSNRIVTNIILL